MKTIHQQVKYKDFEVDEKMLPIIKLLNENGIETLYSCQGDENSRPYVVIKSSDIAEAFVMTLLKTDFIYRNEKMKDTNDNKYFVSGFEATIDYQLGYYRYSIRCLNLDDMNFMFHVVLDILKESKILV